MKSVLQTEFAKVCVWGGHPEILLPYPYDFIAISLFNSATCVALSHPTYLTPYFQIAQMLIDHGADVNTFDKTSKATPLHRAASRYYLMFF